MDKILATRTEAAEALGLSVRAIDYLLAQGRLQSRKIGKRRLIPRAAIESLLVEITRESCRRRKRKTMATKK